MIIFLIIFLLFSSFINAGTLELLDQIESEVSLSEPEETYSDIITTRDIERRAFDGKKHTISDLENQLICDFRGEIMKMVVSDDDINRFVKKQGFSEEQIRSIAEAWDFLNVEAFYTELKKMQRCNSVLSYEMSSEFVVLENEILEYYNSHPERREATYIIETSFSKKSREEIKKELTKLVWDTPIQVNESEIPKSNNFIFKMKEGDIHFKKVSDGFDVFRLNKKTPECLVSLEERRDEIVNKIREQKAPQIIEKVQKNLRSKASIFHPDFQIPSNTDKL